MGFLSRKKRLDEEEQEEQDLEDEDELQEEEELQASKPKPRTTQQAPSNKINKQEVGALISFHLQKAYSYFELFQSLN